MLLKNETVGAYGIGEEEAVEVEAEAELAVAVAPPRFRQLFTSTFNLVLE